MPTKDPTKRAKDGAGAYKSKLEFINGGIIEDEDGNKKSIEGYNKRNDHFDIPNIAVGWSRDEKYIGFKEIYLI